MEEEYILMKEYIAEPGAGSPKVFSKDDAIALANQINDENPGNCCQVKWITERVDDGYTVVRVLDDRATTIVDLGSPW